MDDERKSDLRWHGRMFLWAVAAALAIFVLFWVVLLVGGSLGLWHLDFS